MNKLSYLGGETHIFLLSSFKTPDSRDQIQYDNDNNKFQKTCLSSHNMALTFETLFSQSLYEDMHYKSSYTSQIVLCLANV